MSPRSAAQVLGSVTGLPAEVSALDGSTIGGDVRPVLRGPTRVRISDKVYDELTSAVRDLRLAPGALLSETDLSVQLGVSRTPLREAISRLVDQGLLVVTPQVGTSVALIDLAAVEQACFIRGALETAAFQRACDDPQRDVSALRAILQEQERSLVDEDGNAFFRTDESLHEEIFRLAGFPDAWKVVRRSKLQLDRMRRLILPEVISTRSLTDEHARIVDLLEAGDVEAGTALVHLHAHHVLEQAGPIRATHPGLFTR